MKFYKSALDVFTQQKNDDVVSLIAKTLQNMGNLYIDEENYEKAVETLEECLKTRRSFYGNDTNIEIAHTFNNLANAVFLSR